MKKIFFGLIFFSQFFLNNFFDKYFLQSANAAEIYEFDPLHTNIVWFANHFGFSNPSGKFTKASGKIIIDEANPQNSQVEVVIDINSLQTGLSEFDAHLKNENFFNVEKFPQARFVSKKIIVNGKNAIVSGDFTLLGVTKSIILNVKLNKIGLNNYTQRKTVGFSANTEIKRSDFGMNFGIGGISDKVKISIEVEAFLLNQTKKTD
ncbi:MAG: YceI family protein [Rickettsiales bacterium]|nr:YceI family protein [Rickettsiales bacterium]